jgi:hypothetical protein
MGKKTDFTFWNGITAGCAAEALRFQKVSDWSGLGFGSGLVLLWFEHVLNS